MHARRDRSLTRAAPARARALAILLLLAAPPTHAGPAPVAPIPPAELAAFVDGFFADAMESQHVAGASVAIVQGDGEPLLRGYGIAGVDPLRRVDATTTSFGVGSVTKTFTWLLLLRLVEQGRIALDAPVNDYLPPELRIPDRGFEQPIRIRDLPGHSSGFEDHWLGMIVAEDPATMPTPEEYLRLHRPRRVREPGGFSSYSNYGANLAGAIVARVEGADLPTVAERALFGPLGLAHTTLREPYAARPGLPAPLAPALAARRSSGFIWAGGTFRPARREYFAMAAAAGGAYTTAADMARYLRLLLRGGELDGVRVYGPATARALRTPLLVVPDGVNGWAHGFMVLTLPGGHTGYGHDGATLYQNATLVIVPDLDLGVFVATNSGGGALGPRFVRRLVERWYAAPTAPAAGDPALDAKAARYAGSYLSTRRSYGGLELFEEFHSDALLTVSVGGGYLRTAIGGAVQAWVPDGASGRFRSVHGVDRLSFDLDARGRALGFETARGTSRYERVGFWRDPAVYAALQRATYLAIAWLLIAGVRAERARAAPSRARRIGLASGLLWAIAIVAVARWVAGIDEIALAYSFPDPLLLGGAWLSLTAAAATCAFAGSAMRERVRGGAYARSAAAIPVADVLATLVLLGYATTLAARGLLAPWY